MVSLAASAVGMHVWPSFSSATNVSVAMASISGTIRWGFSSATTRRMASPSSMEKTCERWATCMAGAFS